MMNLKEIGTYNYKDKEFIILESKSKEDNKTLYEYWVSIRGYGLIEGVYGLFERVQADDVWEYILYYGLKHYIEHFDGIEED